MPNFAERLRMGSIYGGGNAFSPRQESPFGMLDQFIKRLPPQQPALQQIGQQVAQPEQEPRVAFAQGINPYQEAQLAFKQRELESKEKLAGEREETRRGALDISQQRANIYKFKAENPGVKFVINKVTGGMEAVNPVTGQTVRDFGQTQLGQEDLINLNQEKAIERIETTGGEARKTEEVRQKGRETLEDMRARHAREQAEFTSGLPSRSASLPSQQKNAVELQYNRLINQRPDLREFVKRDATTGEITIADPADYPGMEEQIKYINNFIFGKAKKDVKLSTETKPNGDAAAKAAEFIKKYGGKK